MTFSHRPVLCHRRQLEPRLPPGLRLFICCFAPFLTLCLSRTYRVYWVRAGLGNVAARLDNLPGSWPPVL